MPGCTIYADGISGAAGSPGGWGARVLAATDSSHGSTFKSCFRDPADAHPAAAANALTAALASGSVPRGSSVTLVPASRAAADRLRSPSDPFARVVDALAARHGISLRISGPSPCAAASAAQAMASAWSEHSMAETALARLTRVQPRNKDTRVQWEDPQPGDVLGLAADLRERGFVRLAQMRRIVCSAASALRGDPASWEGLRERCDYAFEPDAPPEAVADWIERTERNGPAATRVALARAFPPDLGARGHAAAWPETLAAARLSEAARYIPGAGLAQSPSP